MRKNLFTCLVLLGTFAASAQQQWLRHDGTQFYFGEGADINLTNKQFWIGTAGNCSWTLTPGGTTLMSIDTDGVFSLGGAIAAMTTPKFIGNASVSGTFTNTGAASFASTVMVGGGLAVAGNTTLTNALQVQGNQTNSGTFNVAGATMLGGAANVAGILNATSAVVAQATLVVGTNAPIFTTNIAQFNTPTKIDAVSLATDNKFFANVPFTAVDLATNKMGIYVAAGGITNVDGYYQTPGQGIFVRGSTAIFETRATGINLGANILGFGTIGSSANAGLSGLATGVVDFNTGTAQNHAGWYQWGGEARLATNMTTTGTTLANFGLNSGVSVTSGRAYSFTLTIFFNVGLAVDGIKVDFGGGGAAATTFRAHGVMSGVSGGTLTTAQVTSLTTVINGAAVTTDDEQIVIRGYFVPSSSGTFIPRFAKNADTAGATLTVYAGAHLIMDDMP